jgi:hypothetical protein
VGPELEAQHLGLHHAPDGGDLAQKSGEIGWSMDQGDGRAAGRVAAEMEGGDIDLVLAQDRPSRPMKPGLSSLVM